MTKYHQIVKEPDDITSQYENPPFGTGFLCLMTIRHPKFGVYGLGREFPKKTSILTLGYLYLSTIAVPEAFLYLPSC